MILAGGGLIYHQARPPAAPGFTANLYLSPSAGSSGCARSSTEIDYATALSTNHVCDKWTTACSAATGGDKVGVKAGQYTSEIPAQSTLALFDDDCSDGLASDVDPTQLAAGTQPSAVSDVANNWVEFACADGETPASSSGPSSSTVYDDFGDFTPHGNNHMWVHGGCFVFSSILFGRNGDTTLKAQNLILDGVQIQAFEMKGPKNMWINNSQLGPFVACNTSGGTACLSSGSPIGWFEERWASRGSSDKTGEGIAGPNAGGVIAENILFSDFWDHDQQTKNSNSWHPGCLLLIDNNGGGTTTPTDNFIIRNMKCERVAVQGTQVSEFDGLTIENSQYACPTYPLDDATNNPSGLWAKPVCDARGPFLRTTDNTVRDNILFRYNSVSSLIDMATNTEVGTNVRAIGNVANNIICPTDVTGDYNIRISGSACGTNNSTTTNPWVDNDAGTSYSATTQINMHLSGSPGDFAWENGITPTSSDYTLTVDMDNAARTSGSRDPGADER